LFGLRTSLTPRLPHRCKGEELPARQPAASRRLSKSIIFFMTVTPMPIHATDPEGIRRPGFSARSGSM
jgi:hypothetical protein